MRPLFHAFVLAAVLLLAMPPIACCEERIVLVIPKSERVRYWSWVQQGAVEAGGERGVRVVWRGPLNPSDHEAQLRIIRSGIEDRVDAIVLAPNHISKGAPLLDEARREGIRIVIMDSDMEFEGRVTLVGTDNYRAGRMAGLHMLTLVRQGEPLLLVRHLPDNQSTMERERGFLAVMTENAPRNPVIDAGYAGASVGEAYHRILEILVEHPEIRSIFCTGESCTLGCIRAVEELGLADRVKAVGFDYTPEIHDAMVRGTLHGTVLQQPYQIGYLSVMAACDALEGRPVPARIVTGTTVLTDVTDFKGIDR